MPKMQISIRIRRTVMQDKIWLTKVFFKNFGINVPEAVLIKPEDAIDERQIIDKIKLPFFVKPTDGGSSFGVTKVKNENK